MKPVDPQLLSCLVCPLTRSELRQEEGFLVGTVGGLRYPIRDGVPVLLAEEADLPEGCESIEHFKQTHRDQILQ